MARKRRPPVSSALYSSLLRSLVPTSLTQPRGRARARPASRQVGGVPSRARSATATAGRGSWSSGRFTGTEGSRSYRVYVPAGLPRTSAVPLLVALHGCGQTGADFAAGSRFNDLADKHGFLVAYPEQSAAYHSQRCWNWFRSSHQVRGHGEPALVAGIIGTLVNETSRWRIDPARVYVAGISAGAAMALIVAATYPNLVAGVGVHSAPPFRSASGPADALAAMQGRGTRVSIPVDDAQPLPPLIIFQGAADSTVRAVNAELVAEQWLANYRQWSDRRLARPALRAVRSSSVPATRPVTARSRRGYRVSRWTAGRRKVVEVWLVDGLGHAWSGGSADGSFSDPRGPRASTQMWTFFAAARSTSMTTAGTSGSAARDVAPPVDRRAVAARSRAGTPG